MKLAVKLLILGLSIVGCSASAFAQNLELPPNLISINADIGKKLLTGSTAKVDYIVRFV